MGSSSNWKSGTNGDWNDASNWNGGIPNGGTTATINAAGNYIVTVDSGDSANSLEFNAAGATLQETAPGSLDISAFFKLDAGTVVLNSANTIGSFSQTGGLVQFFDGGSLGSGTDTLSGGEQIALATVTLSQNTTFTGSATVAAATGTTLMLASANMDWDGSSAPVSITFGDASNKGTIVLDPSAASLQTANGVTVTVADGILQFGNFAGSEMIAFSTAITVDAGATLDTNGNRVAGIPIVIDGTLTNSSATAALFQNGGESTVSGAITGNFSVEVLNSTLTLTGTNSYNGGTTIDSGTELDLGNGGAGGRILAGSAIDDKGLLVDNHSSNDVLSGVISDSGSFTKSGTGATKLSGINVYEGGTTLNSGTLIVTNDSSLGTGSFGSVVRLTGGELLAAADVTLSQNTHFTGATTIAAATGKTLTITLGNMDWDGSSAAVNITFGDATHKGVVVLDPTSESLSTTNAVTVTVADGTLQVGSAAAGGISGLLSNITTVTVDAGATLDINGFSFDPNATVIGGTVTNSSATEAQFQSYVSSTVSGSITGNLDVFVVDGTMTLTGRNSYTGGTTVGGGTTLNLGDGGTGGAILAGSAIDDRGALMDNHSSNDILSGVISDSGSFTKNGTGATTLSGINTYGGGTTLNRGELIINNAQSLGIGGAVALTGGELSATANVTLSQATNFTGTTTVAAATGKTLTLASGTMTWDGSSAPVSITFGDASDKGTVVLAPANGSLNTTNPVIVTVADGTLRLGSNAASVGISSLLSNITTVTINTGAILDMNGFGFEPNTTVIKGTLTNSSATEAQFQTYVGSTVTGSITGNLDLDVVTGTTTVTGTGTYTGGTTIQTSAELDLGNGGAGGSILAGSAIDDGGTLVDNHSVADTLGGVISGTGSFIKEGTGATTLTGANTYSGGTTIAAGATLILTTGGSVLAGSAIVDNGSLIDSRSDTDVLSGVISGSGRFTKSGNGTTTLRGLNTYGGGTSLNKGELIVTNAKSLGTGALTLNSGELLANASISLNNSLHTGGTDTIAAAHGKTLTLGNTPIVMSAGKLVFGDATGNDGTIVLRDQLSLNDPAHTTVEVKAGTVTQGVEDVLSAMLTNIAGTTLDSGATLDAGGHGLGITGLTGAGTLTNSGASTTIFLHGATNFAGAITGHTDVEVFGNANLTGNESFAGALTIEGAFTVRLQGLFKEAVRFAGGSGTLLLATPANFTGTIQGFQAGTTIDLRNLKSTHDTFSYNTTTHILTVSDGTNSDQLHFAGSYAQGNFAAKDDGTGHADIIFHTIAPASPDVMAAPGPDQTTPDLTATDFGYNTHHAGDWIG